jgi:hypothetical protein
MATKLIKRLKTIILIIISIAVIIVGFWVGILVLIKADTMPLPFYWLFWFLGFELMIGPTIGLSMYLYYRFKVTVQPKTSVWKEIVIITLTPTILFGLIAALFYVKPDFGSGNTLYSMAIVFIPIGIFIGVISIYIFHEPKTIDIVTKLSIAGFINLFLVVIFLVRMMTMIPAKRTLDRSTGYAKANIIDMQENATFELGEFKIGNRNQLTLEFIPTMAITLQQTQILNAVVNKKKWGQLKKGQKINIRYATENPRILLIEGEY